MILGTIAQLTKQLSVQRAEEAKSIGVKKEVKPCSFSINVQEFQGSLLNQIKAFSINQIQKQFRGGFTLQWENRLALACQQVMHEILHQIYDVLDIDQRKRAPKGKLCQMNKKQAAINEQIHFISSLNKMMKQNWKGYVPIRQILKHNKIKQFFNLELPSLSIDAAVNSQCVKNYEEFIQKQSILLRRAVSGYSNKLWVNYTSVRLLDLDSQTNLQRVREMEVPLFYIEGSQEYNESDILQMLGLIGSKGQIFEYVKNEDPGINCLEEVFSIKLISYPSSNRKTSMFVLVLMDNFFEICPRSLEECLKQVINIPHLYHKYRIEICSVQEYRQRQKVNESLIESMRKLEVNPKIGHSDETYGLNDALEYDNSLFFI